jgi:hypothetical protein
VEDRLTSRPQGELLMLVAVAALMSGCASLTPAGENVARTATGLPERSSTVLTIAAPGPVTMISRTPVLAGTVKSTSLARSDVTVTFAAAVAATEEHEPPPPTISVNVRRALCDFGSRELG